jgi:hypothetical protein
VCAGIRDEIAKCLEDWSARFPAAPGPELKTYKALRIYHADDDDEAKRKITEIMDAGISKWPA